MRMNSCKDTMERLSWRILVCTLNQRVRVGVFPMGFGRAWSRSCPSIAHRCWVGGHDWNCGRSPTAFSTFCEPAANGKRLPTSLAPAVPCTATSKSGRDATSSISSGSICCGATTRLRGIQWKWQSLDGATTKAPLGGEKNRAKPDRSGQVGRQAVDADRRPRRAVGLGG